MNWNIEVPNAAVLLNERKPESIETSIRTGENERCMVHGFSLLNEY